MDRAPRLRMRFWRCAARGAGLVAALLSAAAAGAEITDALYAQPTDRYPHGVLGDDIEYGTLLLAHTTQGQVRITLPPSRVFEDTAPRLVDIDGDGDREALVVESHETQGARAALYDETGLIAATPFIGTRFRWLAPAGIGAADLDGDGAVEIAYVDRPHLAKTLRIWRFAQGRLTEVAQMAGLTNHSIGETDIAGGIRDCGAGPEIILADASWREIRAVRLTDNTLTATRLGPHQDRSSFARAMGCEPLE